MPILVVEKGTNKGQKLAIKAEGTVKIGSAPGANLRLEDDLVNETHFTISFSDGAWWISDAGSRNGTWLNGEAVEDDTALKPGDQIEVGESVLSFTADADSKRIADPMVGQTVGGYRIIERVGRGGMGVVYKATQLSLNREVALKILGKKFVQDKTFIQMFVEEARSAAAMNHPNIVQAYDVGKAKDTYYFSMEFMGGGSVQDILAKEGRITPGRALAMMIGAAKGLEFAEKKHIVHCDIKPDNLMLTEDGSVKIGDLGLSKNLKKEGGSGDNQVFGTPHFVAPEQIQGKPLDHRTDLYSLGASFFRMVSGRTPYTGETARELVMKHLKEPVPTLQSVDTDLPKALDPIVQKLMAKDPGDRYQSANDLVTDLRRAMVEVGADGGYTDLIPGVMEGHRRGKRGVLIGAMVAVVAIIIAIVAVSMGGGNGKPGETEAERIAREQREKEIREREALIAAEGEAGKAFQDLLALEAKLKDPAHPELEKEWKAFIADFPQSRFAPDIKAKLDAIPGIRKQLVADQVGKKWTAFQNQYGNKPATDAAAMKALEAFITDAEQVAKDTGLEIPELKRARERLQKAQESLAADAAVVAEAKASYEAVEKAALALIGKEHFGKAKAEIEKFDAKTYAATEYAKKHADLVKSWEQALGIALRKRGEEAKALEKSNDLDGAIAKWAYVRDTFGVDGPRELAEKEIARIEAEKQRRADEAHRRLVAEERQKLGKADQKAKPAIEEYDFGTALAIYQQLEGDGTITTEEVKRDLEARRRDFDHAVAALQALVAACEGPAKGNEIALPEGVRGDNAKIDGANEKGVSVDVSFGRQKARILVEWTKFSPAELLAVFHRHVPASARAALQRAVLALIWRQNAEVGPALDEAERSPDDAILVEVKYYRGRASGSAAGVGDEAAAAKLRAEAIELLKQAEQEPDPLKAKGLYLEAIKRLQELKKRFPNAKAVRGK